jgi:hypothetical protein
MDPSPLKSTVDLARAKRLDGRQREPVRAHDNPWMRKPPLPREADMKVETRPRPLRRPARPDAHTPEPLLEPTFPDPVACPKCGASYRGGRWTWAAAAEGTLKLKCPACRRTEANYPAGELTLTGPFLRGHRAEVLKIVMTREARARRDHPMQRIIDVLEVTGGVRVTTTDGTLLRSIALAVHEACKGELDLCFEKDPTFVRAAWFR